MRSRTGMAAIAAGFVIGLASTAAAQNITGSDHDFSGDAWSGGSICIVCHTPHNGDQNVQEAPLWNHTVTQEAAYQVYTSPTMNAATGQPGGTSKLCLSCHDGTVAIDSYGGRNGNTLMNGGAMLGSDLSNDHPVSFVFDAALAAADGDLHDPSLAPSGLGGTIASDMLFGNKMECGSCHDVHDNSNGNFLRVDNAGSALCLTCHDK